MALRHRLFITGATGAIGQCLVRELSCRDDVERLYALEHRTPVEERHSALSPMRGDVTHGKDLGLVPEDLALLKGEVTGIVHLAADTRFAAPLDELQRTNVHGLENVLAFADECRSLDRVLVLSTTHVAGCRTGVIREDELEHDAGFVNAYEAAKYEAEVVARGRRSSLPLSVCRVSTVVGDSTTGEIARRGAIHHSVLALLAGLAPLLPGSESSPVDLLALDDASRAIAVLATDLFEPGESWHLCGGADTVPAGELVDLTMHVIGLHRPAWRTRALERPAFVDLETFELFCRSVDEVGDSAMRAATDIVARFAPQLAYPKQFDDRRCRSRLASARLARAPVRDVWAAAVTRLVRPRSAAQ